MVTSQAGHVCRGVQAEKESSQPLYKAIHHGCCQDYRFWGKKYTTSDCKRNKTRDFEAPWKE